MSLGLRLASWLCPRRRRPPPFPLPEYIAHGGGTVRGLGYTNSLESLDANYLGGYRFFEIDFDWTSDDQLVLVHDWEEVFEHIFRQPKGTAIPSLEQFLGLRMKENLTPLNSANLADWLRAHPDARIVTDIKNRNLEGLRRISAESPDLVDQIIPQVFAFEEYDLVRNMGYSNIILTLYLNNYSDRLALAFARYKRPFGIAMWASRAKGSLPKRLRKLGVAVFAHTVNSPEEARELAANGVDGFYTDCLEVSQQPPSSVSR
jgi:glycerophosphoryl diester phosphodiesterase